MSTREFLAKLDLDQLRHAKDLATELLAAREQEQRLPVWEVSDASFRLAVFPSEGYLRAAEFLLAKARENAVSQPPARPRAMQLQLSARMVPASEYSGWAALFEPDTPEPPAGSQA